MRDYTYKMIEKRMYESDKRYEVYKTDDHSRYDSSQLIDNSYMKKRKMIYPRRVILVHTLLFRSKF